jgi:hypothetical protein
VCVWEETANKNYYEKADYGNGRRITGKFEK